MKTIIILIIMFMILLTSSIAYQTNSTSYDALMYFGAGGYAEQTATLDVGTGIGQTVIGEINNAAFSYSIYYGIFWVNVTYTAPSALFLPVSIYIEDFGIEWIKLNWTM